MKIFRSLRHKESATTAEPPLTNDDGEDLGEENQIAEEDAAEKKRHSLPRLSLKKSSVPKKEVKPQLWVKEQRDNILILGYALPEEFIGKPILVAVGLKDERKKLLDALAENRAQQQHQLSQIGKLTPQEMTKASQLKMRQMQQFTSTKEAVWDQYETKFGQPGIHPIEGLMEYLRMSQAGEDIGDFDEDSPGVEDGLGDDEPHWAELRYLGELGNCCLAEEDGQLTLYRVPQDAELEIFLFFNIAEDDDEEKRRIAPLWTLRLALTTNRATWAAMLSQNGMSSLVPMFERNNLTRVAQWAEIIDDFDQRRRLNIDEVAAARLNKIITRFGYITVAERKRLEKENEELKIFLEHTEEKMANDTPDLFYMGQLVETRSRKPDKYVVLTTPDESDDVVVVRDALDDSTQAGQFIPVKNLRPSSWTLFLSHAQNQAQNQVQSLHLLLRKEDVPCWYDMDAEKLEPVDMLRGIRDSEYFVLYLTEGYLDRFFCRMESTYAMRNNKKVIIIFESDNRHGGGQYTDLVARCTAKFPEFKDWLMSVEAIPMARRAFQREAMIHEILKRCGITKQLLNRNRGSGTAVEAQLRGQVEDLKEEVNKLWAVIEALQDQLAANQNNNDEDFSAPAPAASPAAPASDLHW